VAVLLINLVRGVAFHPRPPLFPGKDQAAAVAAIDRRDRAPAAPEVEPPIVESLIAQNETRLGGALGNTADAEESAKKVEKIRGELKLKPDDHNLHFELGNALYDTGDSPSAISEYRRAIELNPKFVKAYVNLGETLRERGDTRESIETLEKAISIDARDDVAHSALGFAYYSEKRYPDAIHEFRKALEINPKSVHGTYYMGMAFADAQIYCEAIRWWDKVCAIDPNSDACFEARENNNLLRRIANCPPPARP
jgi:tetratricopeptide (TPR) repeat protein